MLSAVRPGARAALAVALTGAVTASAFVPAAVPATAQAVPDPSPTVAGIPCYEGSGPRVQVLYLHKTGTPSDLATRLPLLRDAVAQVDAVFAASARRTGGVRHVRFRTAGCELVVRPVAVPSADLAAALGAAKRARALAPGDTALAFAGPSLGGFTGDATRPVDDRPGARNLSNAGGQLALVGAPSWGSVDAPAALLARALGAVQAGAPHASAAGGCTDGADPLCYDDLTIASPVTTPCGPSGRYLLDCRNDDYFSTAPRAGSWLARHWNVADSVFLSSAPPPRTSPVTAIDVAVEGVPADGRVGPQTPLTVRMTGGAALERVLLVGDRAPGLQPLPVTGSGDARVGTGALAALASTGPGELFALATDALGRTRLSPVTRVSFVGGARLRLGAPGEALRGAVPYTVELDRSGDQAAVTRLLVFRGRTGSAEPVVLVDRPVEAGVTRWTGTLDSALLADGDDQQVVLVLADASGAPVAGSQTSVVRAVSNRRPALRLGVEAGAVLPAATTLTATVTPPATGAAAVQSVRYTRTDSDCRSGRAIGSASRPPFSVRYDVAREWRGPETRWALCATAVLADGTTTTVGPVPVSTTSPDTVALRLAPGARLAVGLHRLPVAVRIASGRRLRALQVFEGPPGGRSRIVLSRPVTTARPPATLDLVVPAQAVGRRSLYVRAVFADAAGEFLRSAAVPVQVVPGAAPTARLSSSSVTAGEQVRVSGTARPGAPLRILTSSRPATAFTVLRTGSVPADGRFSAVLSPRTGTRVRVEVAGGGRAPDLAVEVRTAVTLSVTRTAPRTYRFSGTTTPARAGRTVTVAQRTSGQAAARLVTVRTAADGRWTATHRFASAGTVDLVAVSSADALNAQGSSATRRTTVS